MRHWDPRSYMMWLMSSSASYAERQEQRLVGILRHHLYWQDISDIFKGLYSPRIIGHSQYKNLKKTNPATAVALHPWDSNCVSTKCFRHMRDLSPALKTHRWIALASYALPELLWQMPWTYPFKITFSTILSFWEQRKEKTVRYFTNLYPKVLKNQADQSPGKQAMFARWGFKNGSPWERDKRGTQASSQASKNSSTCCWELCRTPLSSRIHRRQQTSSLGPASRIIYRHSPFSHF